MEASSSEDKPQKDCSNEENQQSSNLSSGKGKTSKYKKVVINNSDSSDDEIEKTNSDITKVKQPKDVEQKSSEVRRRFYANCDAAYRSSWHGTLPEPPTEPEVAGARTSGITVRSRSHGNLQQKSKLNFFKRRSYPVNPSPPLSPSKSSSSGFKSLFQNIKKSKKSANTNKDARIRCSTSSEQFVTSTEVDTDQTQQKRVRASPEIISADQLISCRNRSHVTRTDTGSVVQDTQNTTSQSESNNTQSHGLPSSSNQTGPRTHPIHTFQLVQCRNSGNQSTRASSFIFGRTRSKKSVIKETEENLTHPGIIVLLSVINFIIWMFLFSVKFARCTAKVSIWIWLKLVYSFDFIVKLFYRIFNIDPEKANQNSDFSHIESKYILLVFCLTNIKSPS